MKERGLTMADAAFPRLISRGPIEAQPCGPHHRDKPPFPRLISRGPIEA